MGQKLEQSLNMLIRVRAFRTARWFNPRSLTVLNYHRVADPEKDGFESFRPNISAAPEMFARQMDYLCEYFNVISGSELSAWLYQKQALPPHAAMITFDDGYHDNWANAYPILKARNLPAIIFLTTNYIEKNTPFYWDTLAYAFRHTTRNQAVFPMIGLQSWHDDHEMKRIMLMWAAAGKLLPDREKEENLQKTLEILEVNLPEDAFNGMHLTWDQVREMAQNRIEMGSHTMSHPILTRVPLAQVEKELRGSKERIEAEIGMPVLSFAYPNGGSADFTPQTQNLLRGFGYKFAFSLMPGPTWYATVKKDPYAIRRIFLSHADTFGRFVGKITGLARLTER